MADDIPYYSIEKQVSARLKIKRSDFVCTLAPVADLAQAKTFISQVSKANKTATHNCWAYVVGEDARVFHSSDAGEPSGSAGKPMLNALMHHRLTDVAAVVTRTYGGVKLGMRGLMDAYFEAVDEAVSRAGLIRRIPLMGLSIQVQYDFNGTLLSQMKQFQIELKRTDYTNQVCHTLQVALADKSAVLELLERHRSAGRLTFSCL